MDLLLEQKIIDLYVSKEYQERVLYELRIPKKRNKVLHRLCHNYANIIRPQTIERIMTSDAIEIAQMLLKYGGLKDKCYMLSLLKGYDGIFLPLDEALRKAIGNGMATLIYCYNGIAYFEAEQEKGSAPRFILKA